ncbi:MAG TPA: hypothetical protein VL263_09285 [Vicinamibacterales bacterium]|nr:hypothetical protein [Vicinamibacterales bacterium]
MASSAGQHCGVAPHEDRIESAEPGFALEEMAVNGWTSGATGREQGASTLLAALIVCLMMAGVAAGQAAQQPEGSKPQEGGKQQPQQPAPPEDSPEPLANAKRPYESLFGGASTEKETGTRVNFNGSVIEVYDQDELEEGEPQLGGLYTSFTGDVDYKRNGTRMQFAASGGGNLRYYHEISQFLAADYRGTAGVEADVARRTTLVLNQAVSLSPVSLPNLFATPLPPEIGDPVPPGNSNFAVTNDKFITSTTIGSLEHRFSVQSQLVVRGNYRYNHYLGEASQNGDWSMLDSGVVYRHRLTEARSIRTGYSYRRASYSYTNLLTGAGAQPNEHNVFVGVAVNRVFSSSQRTTVSLDGGTSLFGVTSPTQLLQPGDKLRLVFDATVAHSIGKTWLFVGQFDRGSQFDQGYGGPVFANAVSVSASGFLNSRTDFTAWASLTDGEPIVVAPNSQGFTTSTYGGRLRYALSRNWALTGEYFRYKYDFTNSPPYPFLIGVPQKFARNSIRGGVVVFFPLVP